MLPTLPIIIMEVFFLDNNLHFEKEVILSCIQILDFKSSDGEIKGYKLHYITEPSGDYKENYIGGKHEEAFIKDDNYKITLKPFLTKVKSLPCKIKLDLVVVSTDKPPKISKIII